MMLNRKRRMKLVALMASGAMVLAFGGCLGGVLRQAGIGFARGLGAAPAAAVESALNLSGLISGALPSTTTGG